MGNVEVVADMPARGGGAARRALVTPSALAAARAHIGCDSLQGVELEDAGGNGTAGVLHLFTTCMLALDDRMPCATLPWLQESVCHCLESGRRSFYGQLMCSASSCCEMQIGTLKLPMVFGNSVTSCATKNNPALRSQAAWLSCCESLRAGHAACVCR